MPNRETTTIQKANDQFRRGEPGIPGKWVMTQGIAAAIEKMGATPQDVIVIVQRFETFTEDNDPYGTHEFGSFEFAGETCFWKIDLYDADLQFGSSHPTDLSKTKRVLTTMLASEY